MNVQEDGRRAELRVRILAADEEGGFQEIGAWERTSLRTSISSDLSARLGMMR